MYQNSPYMIFMLPKGEAYSRHFVHPVVRPSVRYLGRQITLKLLLGYIYRWQWGEGRTVPINHNPTLYIYWVISPFFIMVACPGHILESTKGIEIKLCTYIDVNERKKTRTIILSYNLHLSLFFFIKGCFLCYVLVYMWCWITSSAFYRQ